MGVVGWWESDVASSGSACATFHQPRPRPHAYVPPDPRLELPCDAHVHRWGSYDGGWEGAWGGVANGHRGGYILGAAKLSTGYY